MDKAEFVQKMLKSPFLKLRSDVKSIKISAEVYQDEKEGWYFLFIVSCSPKHLEGMPSHLSSIGPWNRPQIAIEEMRIAKKSFKTEISSALTEMGAELPLLEGEDLLHVYNGIFSIRKD